MTEVIGPECSFLIPLRRDKVLSDGKLHTRKTWEWLKSELLTRFEGFTFARQAYPGKYIDRYVRRPVADESRKFFVAIPLKQLDELRELFPSRLQQVQAEVDLSVCCGTRRVHWTRSG
jgi:hypothetical protein